MSYGSAIDHENQKIKKTVLPTTVTELVWAHAKFLSGMWMDPSGEVTDINMRTDAMNLVTTARTIHLPEGKKKQLT